MHRISSSALIHHLGRQAADCRFPNVATAVDHFAAAATSDHPRRMLLEEGNEIATAVAREGAGCYTGRYRRSHSSHAAVSLPVLVNMEITDALNASDGRICVSSSHHSFVTNS
jgi:hypothetical protein